MILSMDAWSVEGRFRAGPILFDTETITCITPQPSNEKGPATYYEIFLQSGVNIAVKADMFTNELLPYLPSKWREFLRV